MVAALSYLLACLEGDAAKGWVEPMVILVILLINALVSTWQELSAADALSALQRLQPETARCLRQAPCPYPYPTPTPYLYHLALGLALGLALALALALALPRDRAKPPG